MESYIKSIDRTRPLGKLVYEYGQKEFYKGLFFGFLSGIVSVYLFNNTVIGKALHF